MRMANRMKVHSAYRPRLFVVAILVAAALSAAPNAGAQSALLDLPDASPRARVVQRIGLTDVTIDFHRPLVRGRKIFGGLQPYGQVWRAGADQNTVIQFSDPVTINGQPLAKGSYGVHMIPGETSWVVIFSKNHTSWGSFTYNQAEDALRVTVTPEAVENQEALSYEFSDLKLNSAVVTMRWEKVAVPFKVEVNTSEIVTASLRNQLRGRQQFEWEAWQDAADYLLNNKMGAEDAEKYAEQSISIEDRFENEMTKSRALVALGRNDEAVAARKKALSMASQQQVYSYARQLQAGGDQADALEIFRDDINKDPDTRLAHLARARLAVANGDFDTGSKELKLALALTTDPSFKSQIAVMITRVDNRDDINK